MCPTRRWPTRCVGVLAANGALRAMVVYGDDGLDELSTTGPSTVHELIRSSDGEYDRSTYRVDPAELGLPLATIEDLRGGDAAFNAAAIRRVIGRGRVAAPGHRRAQRRRRP